MMRKVSVAVGLFLLASVLVSVSVQTLTAQSSDGNRLFELDYPQYRETIEPIFLNRRPGNARCVVCHSQGGGNSFLEPLPPGREAYDEEQSIRNFERVQRLVVPGQPLESILLVNPLTEDAAESLACGRQALGVAGSSRMASAGRLGWQYDRWRRLRLLPQPCRADFFESPTRQCACVVCHSQGGGNSFLEPLPPGRDLWDEEQSFRNFERVRRLITPGAPLGEHSPG